MNINNGVVVQKPFKAREVMKNQQEREQGSPSNLEDIDNEIPQFNPTKVDK